jgi:diguanylate cyclase (GGDEF)-like protein
MKQQKARHQHNVALFYSYLKDLRFGIGIAFLGVALIVFLTYSTANPDYLVFWVFLILSIDVATLLGFKSFQLDFDENQFKRYLVWHYVTITTLGAAWGSGCLLLLPNGPLNNNQTLVLASLFVIVAYSASAMSAFKTGLFSFVTPILLCLLIFFAQDLNHYDAWFVATIILGVCSFLFGKLNHQHAINEVNNQIENNRNIEELTRLKASIEKANMELVLKNEVLIAAQNRLELLATNDELTQVFNRRYAMDYLSKLFADMKRNRTNFVVVLADIDYFKSVNDRFGHPAGDEVLRRFSATIKQQLREVDLVARYGGEEFLIVLPKTKELEAKAIVQRLCELVADEVFDFDHQKINVTSSFGLASYQSGDTIEKLIERADLALYHAKKSGRNNVKSFEDAVYDVALARQ